MNKTRRNRQRRNLKERDNPWTLNIGNHYYIESKLFRERNYGETKTVNRTYDKRGEVLTI